MEIAANEAAEKKRDEARAAWYYQQKAKWELEITKRDEESRAKRNDKYERDQAAIIERMRQRDELAKKPPAKIGMSAAMVQEKTNWGAPKSVNRTTTSQGVMEQWVYEGGQYLYFRNSKLYAIQN